MAKRKQKTSLLSRLGEAGEKAVAQAREKPVQYSSGGDLPAGIDNGIAVLTSAKIGEYKEGTQNAGELYVRFAGTVKSPKTIKDSDGNVIPVEGGQTSIMEPLCETPNKSRKSISDHIEWVMNEIKKLGIDTSNFGLAELEQAIEMLNELKPTFKFRTWKGEATEQFPNPRVNHVWNGVIDSSLLSDDEDDEVQDETEPDDVVEEVEEEETESNEDKDFEDVLQLAELADESDDIEAAEKLTKLALKNSIDQDTIDNAESWKEVAERILESQGEDSDAEAGEEVDVVIDPEKGDIYYYTPPKSKKQVEVEITAVFNSSKTVNCKNLIDGKTIYKKVSWDKLQEG